MKKILAITLVLTLMLSFSVAAFDWRQLLPFRTVTGFSSANQLATSSNSYLFLLGDNLLLPSGKEVVLEDLRSDNTIEVSVSGSRGIIGLNDYKILSDVQIYYVSKLKAAEGKIQLNIQDFSRVESAKLQNDGSYLFLPGSKLIFNGNVLYVDNVLGNSASLYVDGKKDSLAQGESKNINKLRVTFLDYVAASSGSAVKIRVERAVCIDSDNGEQIFIKGHIINAGGDSRVDSCMQIITGVKESEADSCAGAYCYVREGYCDPQLPQSMTPKYVKCNTCLNGACEQDTSLTKNTPDVKSAMSKSTKSPELFVKQNSVDAITLAWNGFGYKRFNVYMNKDDGLWSLVKALATESYTLEKPAKGVVYGFYATAADEKESFPSLPIYVTAQSNGKCKDKDALSSDTSGYISYGQDLIIDSCENDQVIEGYCMDDGAYGLKLLGKSGFTCSLGALKEKPHDDCRANGCKHGESCVKTTAALETYNCVKAAERAVPKDKDAQIKTLEEEVRQLKARVDFLEGKLKVYEPLLFTEQICSKGKFKCSKTSTGRLMLQECLVESEGWKNLLECGKCDEETGSCSSVPEELEPECGNAVCEKGETLFNCAKDCKQKNAVSCGDGVCDSRYEDKNLCFEDCSSAEERTSSSSRFRDWLRSL